MKRLEGKNALVTGGSRGIGEAIVIRLAEEGASVAINYTSDRSKELALQVKQKVEKLGGKACVVRADVGNKKQVEAMFQQVEAELGEIDILVNNAGIAPFEPFLEVAGRTLIHAFLLHSENEIIPSLLRFFLQKAKG